MPSFSALFSGSAWEGEGDCMPAFYAVFGDLGLDWEGRKGMARRQVISFIIMNIYFLKGNNLLFIMCVN